MDVPIGELKEGRARVNRVLRRAQTVAFALRELGCCPEEQPDKEARMLVPSGQRDPAMPG